MIAESEIGRKADVVDDGVTEATDRATGLSNIVRMSPEQFAAAKRILKEAQAVIKAAKPARPTPQDIADDFIAYARQRDEHYVYWCASWYRWEPTHGRYRQLIADDLRAELRTFLRRPGGDYASTAHASTFVNNIIDVLKGDQRLYAQSHRVLPFSMHVSDAHVEKSDQVVAFPNGRLNVDAFIRGEASAFQPPSPNWFTTFAMPYRYDPTASCPRWLAFVEQVFGGDREIIDLIQEWFGYCLVPDNSYQRVMGFIGEPGHSKGATARTLQELVGGTDNVSAVLLRQLSGRFSLEPMIGKLLNIAPEMTELKEQDLQMLKAISGGDQVPVDRKGIQMVGMKIMTRQLFQTNHMPPCSDPAMRRRLLPVPFKVKPKTVDQTLEPTLQGEERSGIFNWSMSGLKRLRERGDFTMPRACRKLLEQHILESNSVLMFINDEVEHKPGYGVWAGELYDRYKDCYDASGEDRKGRLSKLEFGKQVCRYLGIEETPRTRDEQGVQKRLYPGLYHAKCQAVPYGATRAKAA